MEPKTDTKQSPQTLPSFLPPSDLAFPSWTQGLHLVQPAVLVLTHEVLLLPSPFATHGLSIRSCPSHPFGRDPSDWD